MPKLRDTRPTWFTVIAAIWIFGAAAVYYVHFTLAFVNANREAIQATWDRLAGFVGLG